MKFIYQIHDSPRHCVFKIMFWNMCFNSESGPMAGGEVHAVRFLVRSNSPASERPPRRGERRRRRSSLTRDSAPDGSCC